VATVKRAGAYHRAPNTARAWATTDLVTIAFFFLLWVGEYAMPQNNVRTQTIQFRVQDITFPHNGVPLPNTLPFLQLSNTQKNGERGATIHHTSCPTWFCLVKAMARRVTSIMAHEVVQTTPLSFVSPGIHVVASNITRLVHQAAVDTHLVAQG
jgi:hypothetical protein